MEGATFYFSCWGLWVYLTFIESKQNPHRFILSAGALILIILSNIHFSIGKNEFYAGSLFLLLVSYYVFSREKLRTVLYYFICTYIISISYVTFHLFEIFDPIWIIFKKEWMMAIGFWYLAILLHNTLKGRLLIIICGTIQGEVLYAYIVSRFNFSYSIGNLSYLDVCSLISGLILGWSILEHAGTFIQNHIHFFEKTKQKSS